MRKLAPESRGFSLVELAIVLAVVSILTAGAISMFRTQREHSIISETRNSLDQAKEAIYAWAAINGGLPCPDTDGDGESNIAPCLRRGTIPWATLGLSRSDDGWAQPLLYLTSPNLIAGTLTRLTQTGDIAVTGSATAVPTATAISFALWSAGPDRTDASTAEVGASNRVIVGDPSGATIVDDIVTWGSRFTMVGQILQTGHILTLN